MSEEEINYWLEVFSEDRFAFKSKDGKVLSFYKTFENMKELQQENTQLKERINKANELTKFYKQELDDWKPMCIVDEYDEILKGDSNE